jgi:dolichol-phosphate mannosyltransferase
MRTLTVVSPAHEEEEALPAFHAELRRALDSVADRWQSTVLFVVDRGADRTLDVLREIAGREPSVRVLALSARFGQQAALLAGLDHCDSDAVAMMDSDGQHPPSLLPELLAGLERGFDVVYTVREATSGLPFLKRLTSRLFYRLLGGMSDTPIVPGAADFRVVSRRVVELFQARIRERTLFLRGLFSWVGFPSLAVPFAARPRRAGRTKFPLGRMLRFGLDGLVSFSRVPLRAALALGLAFLGLGITGLLAGLVRSLVGVTATPLWLWGAALLLLLAGTQLFFLGVVGEYVGAILDEVKARPHYVVEERINFPPAAR